MSLKDEILAAFPGLTAKTRDDKTIAEQLSAGRFKITSVPGGIAKFVELLGVAEAVAYLKTATDPATVDYWLVEAMRDARCDLGGPGMVAMYTVANFTPEQRTALVGGLTIPDPITERDVAAALEGFGDPPRDPREKPVIIDDAVAVEANVKN